MFYLPIMIQMGVCCFLLTLTGLQLLTLPEFFSAQVLARIQHLSYTFIDLFIYCYRGEELMNEVSWWLKYKQTFNKFSYYRAQTSRTRFTRVDGTIWSSRLEIKRDIKPSGRWSWYLLLDPASKSLFLEEVWSL